MALQPNQRASMRGKMKTANRAQPRMVNRTNKTVLVELVPLHEKTGPRFASWYMRAAWHY